SIEVKGMHDFVTYVDKASEALIVGELRKILPDSDFIAEENTAGKTSSEYTWIIDPLDGTTNFIHGIPCFSVSIALRHKEETTLGVVYEVNRSECFYSSGKGTFLNGDPVKVSSMNKLESSFLATGFPYSNFSRMDSFIPHFKEILSKTTGVRRLGSAAADLAYVACGRFDAFWEYDLKPWDVAAGAFLVKQAGGEVTDFKGEDNYVFGGEMVAGNPAIHKELLDSIKMHF
ncbi:MAG: inositol monophosphatase family protein, partial [Bacteroidota bacterium]